MRSELFQPMTPGNLRRGLQVACWKCVQELGEAADAYAEAGFEDFFGLCAVHFSELPSAIREAVGRGEERYRGLYLEIESLVQWSEVLGKVIRPGDRVDALSYLHRNLAVGSR